MYTGSQNDLWIMWQISISIIAIFEERHSRIQQACLHHATKAKLCEFINIFSWRLKAGEPDQSTPTRPSCQRIYRTCHNCLCLRFYKHYCVGMHDSLQSEKVVLTQLYNEWTWSHKYSHLNETCFFQGCKLFCLWYTISKDQWSAHFMKRGSFFLILQFNYFIHFLWLLHIRHQNKQILACLVNDFQFSSLFCHKNTLFWCNFPLFFIYYFSWDNNKNPWLLTEITWHWCW